MNETVRRRIASAVEAAMRAFETAERALDAEALIAHFADVPEFHVYSDAQRLSYQKMVANIRAGFPKLRAIVGGFQDIDVIVLATDAAPAPSMSVIIPAFNEAGYLPETLDRLRAAERHFKARANAAVEIVVVDNASTDGTADLAQRAGATVVHQLEHNIAKVRNAGAAVARHDVLVFLDADTLVPAELLLTIGREMAHPECAGGAVDAVHQASSLVLRGYFRFWRVIGLLGGMAQGACQFCRRSVFEHLGGYDATQYMGEDVDFFWRLKRFARRGGLRTTFIREFRVVPSPRRWESWPVWRTLIWTNPALVFALRHRKATWAGWLRDAPR